MAGYTMVSAGRCVALGYGTLALFVAYIVFDIWCARNPDALAWNVWSSTEENAAGPAAENSEDAQLPSPAQLQLEPSAAPAEEEPAEPLLVVLRCLVGLGIVVDLIRDLIPDGVAGQCLTMSWRISHRFQFFYRSVMLCYGGTIWTIVLWWKLPRSP